MTTYASAGVDRALGDLASEMLYEAAKATWKNRQGKLGEVIVPLDDFSGLRAIDVSTLPPGTLLNLGFDGIGTKVEIAERVNRHDTMAFDLFAMVCDDAVIRGAEPVLVGSILDVSSLSRDEATFLPEMEALAKGYEAAARAAGVAVVNGELAELGTRVSGAGGFNYNWGASVLWFANRDRIVTGQGVKVGFEVVALREPGFRSNGLSLVRKVLFDTFGEKWHHEQLDGTSIAELALAPSVIYSRAMVDMFGGLQDEPSAPFVGAAHITGGGIPGKLGRLLRVRGWGAVLDQLFSPNPLMLACQEWADISDREAYETWNMGQGMLIVTEKAEDVVHVAASHGLEAAVVGHITEAPEIRIRSKGAMSPGEELVFPHY